MTVVAIALPAAAKAEQASQPTVAAAGQIDAGRHHTCAVLPGGAVRCWGFGGAGQLGYGNTQTIGDNETPGVAGPVKLGEGPDGMSLKTEAISAGDFHTCALLDDATVRCWGFGGDGRLGYGNQDNIGDNETPDAVGPVNLGTGRTAKAITAGGAHTCALLDNNAVRCWGYAFYGQLGYAIRDGFGRPENIGDNESPGSFGPVQLGAERTAVAISAGDLHTCAVLDNGTVRCWGSGAFGRLGYGDQTNIGDDETPDKAGPVSFGGAHTATAISAGTAETCAVLGDSTVRCWGSGANGRLGYGNETSIGDDETLEAVGPVDLGPGTARAISVGDGHACALLGNDAVRCWGYGGDGRLGYANTTDIGDNESPGSVGPVNLGAGRTALAITLGARHSCARLDDANVRCWGFGGNGRLGYCNTANVGDDETPGSRGPVPLTGSRCPPPGGGSTPPPVKPSPAPGAPSAGGKTINGTAGNDTLTGTAGNDVINCGAGDDVVNAGRGDDVINCGAGNDRVNAGAGDDRIDGGSGNDLLSGNEDNDRVLGGSGNERANGNEGNDRVGGQSGNDRVGGQSGHDVVNGERGRDRASGGSGNDRVGGQSGNDRVNGDSGRDRLNGGSGRDRLSGGSGRDSISARDRTRDRVDCGTGRDRVTADRRRGRDRVSRSCERVRRR